MANGAATIPPSLVSDVCPNCGYSLVGLPAEGKCPECGGVYDSSQVILYGWGRGQFENLANAKRSRIARASVVWVGLLAGVAIGLQSNRPSSDPFVAALGVTVLSSVTYMLVKRRHSAHPGLVQIRLCDQGCVQYNDLAGPSAVGYLFVTHYCVAAILVTGVFATIPWPTNLSSVGFLVCFSVLFAAALFEWRIQRRRLLVWRRMWEAELNGALRWRWPWSQIGNFKLNVVSPAACRLQIMIKTRILTKYVIDAELRCTGEQAKELRSLLIGWIDGPGVADYSATRAAGN